MCSFEKDVLIPVDPKAQFQLTKGRADACVAKWLPKDIFLAIDGQTRKEPRYLQLLDALHCMDDADVVVVGIGTLFCVWKRQQEIQAAARQAAIYGLGFQDQRRALGLPSRSMYGLALCEGILHLLVTTLEDDTMVNTCFM